MSHQYDHGRRDRIGMPEAVLCSSKTPTQISAIANELAQVGNPALFTRLSDTLVGEVDASITSAWDHDSMSGTAVLNGSLPARAGRVAVVAAGTSDMLVAAEAARTLEFSGVSAELIVDVGVAGLWRLEQRLDEIKAADVVIAVAGMDAALVSVLGGLVGSPVIAAPRSVGSGVGAGGRTARNSALASCAQGVTVVNIDNGFGAACAAIRMLSMADRFAGGQP